MKRLTTLSIILISFISYVALTSSSGGRANAANSGNTGAPGEGTTCVTCHNSSANFGTVSINIQLFNQGTATPVSSYIPGTAYDLSVSVNNSAGSPGGYGFQLTALTAGTNNPIAGYSSLATNVQEVLLISGRTYLEHNGVTSNNTFNMAWTAPSIGTGSITFYSSGNAVNATGGTGGDAAGLSSLTISEAAVTGPLSVSGITSDVDCNGAMNGGIDVTASGGTGPYTYNWTDLSGTNNIEDRSMLDAGTYTLTVTDNLSATTTESYTITEPSAITLSISDTAATCNGGPAIVTCTAIGGTGNLTYDFGFGSSASSQADLLAGTYTVTVTDQNACSSSLSFEVIEPAGIAVAVMDTEIVCNGGTVLVNCMASGGAGNLTYDFGSGFTNMNTADLTAGSYTVTVQDASGCDRQLAFEVIEPQAIEIVVDNIIADSGTATGAIDISVSGGTAPYSYAWSNSDSTEDISQLPAGSYNVLVTDSLNCTLAFNDITVNQLTSSLNRNAELVDVIIKENRIYINSPLSTPLNVRVINLSGQLIANQWLESGDNLTIEDLSSGLYFYTINDGSGQRLTSGKLFNQ